MACNWGIDIFHSLISKLILNKIERIYKSNIAGPHLYIRTDLSWLNPHLSILYIQLDQNTFVHTAKTAMEVDHRKTTQMKQEDKGDDRHCKQEVVDDKVHRLVFIYFRIPCY